MDPLISLALIVLFFSLMLFVLGLRGRVISRGQFCRRCRFDLTGIDLDNPGARCPECGRAVTGAKGRRTVLRRRSRWALSVASLLMLVLLVIAGILISGRAAAVYAHMPERIVLNASLWGSDPALDELMARSGMKGALSDAAWEAAIEYAIEIQGDESRVWDLRWGEVLYLGATGGQMSDEQLGRYVSKLDRVEVSLRSRVHAGTARLPMTISFVSNRGNAITGGSLGLYRTLRITRAGVEGFERETDPNGAGHPFPLSPKVQRNLGTMSMGISPNIKITKGSQLPQAGETLPVIVEYTVSIAHAEGEAPFLEKTDRFVQDIEVLPVDAEIVKRAQPIGGSAAASQYFTIPDIAVTQPLPEALGKTTSEMIAMFSFQKRQCPMAVAYRVFFRSDAGKEFELTTIVSEGSPNSLSGTGVMVNLRPGKDSQSARLLRAVQIMLDQGHATLVMRVDPDLAIETPGIDRVMDLDLIFDHVPVVPSPPGQFNNSGMFGDTVAARALLDDRTPTAGDKQGETP